MATLVGDEGSGYTSVLNRYSSVQLMFRATAYSVVAAGTVTAANVHVTDWSSASGFYVVAYDTNKDLLGYSDEFTSALGTGLISRSMSLSRALTLSENIYIAIYFNGYMDVRCSSGTWLSRRASITYSHGSPLDPLAGDEADVSGAQLNFLTGTETAAGAPRAAAYYRMMRNR